MNSQTHYELRARKGNHVIRIVTSETAEEIIERQRKERKELPFRLVEVIKTEREVQL